MAKRQKTNKFVDFLNGKGFYAVILACVAAVGISGYLLFFGGGDERDELLAALSSEPSGAPTYAAPSREPLTTAIPDGAVRESEVVMAVGDDAEASSVGGAGSTGDRPSESGEGGAAAGAAAVSGGEERLSGDAVAAAGDAELEPAEPGGVGEGEAARPVASFYVWPLNGEVLNRFSVDQLVFSNTMGDWRVHTGADIAASLGAHVSAAGAGVVEDVYVDELMGCTVVIDHGGSLRTVYRNLADNVQVAVGDAVAAGDVIGAVGATAEAESAESPHLHFEVIEAGAQIDPMDILP